MAAQLIPINAPELDLPLADTPASRFLVWIMGALVYLAVLTFAVVAGADIAVRQQAQQPGLLTVSLPAASDPAAGEAELQRVIERLRAFPGVAYASPVTAEEIAGLIEPWLGRANDAALPRLIDVTFNPGTLPEPELLRAALAPFAAGLAVEEPAAPASGATQNARSLRLLGLGSMLLVLLTMVATVAIVTRMSLDLHGETVDLLRLMGAGDRYVARQFEQHALASALRGGLAGFALGVLTMLGFIVLQAALPWLGLPPLPLRPFDWVLLACVPVASALLTALVARLAAVIGLARLR